MKNRLLQWVREPLLQFLMIGACIYIAYALFGPVDETVDDSLIVVDEGRIEALIVDWERRRNRPPTRAELDGLIDAYVRESILYRQAVAMGLNEDDPITRRRMAQKLEFLTNDLALLKEPEDGELERYFTVHQSRYSEPATITFGHIYFNPDERGELTRDDAATLMTELQAAGPPDRDFLEAGDRFMLQNYYAGATEFDVRRQMGTGFAEALFQLEPQRWHGPVLSGYGVHLVYVYALEPSLPAEFAEVRAEVLGDWQAEQQKAFNKVFFDSLRERYDIVIADVPVDRLPATEPAS